MKTPFTTDQFFEIFERYNTALFPVQVIILILGVVALVLLHSKKALRNKYIGGLLGILWLWTGLVYHITFFSTINPAANAFGGIFILQGVFFFIELFRDRMNFSIEKQSKDYTGYFFIIFGLILYPLISFWLADNVSHTISLGLPCPTTIVTFGFLMLTQRNFSKYLLIIPTIWAVIGTGAAVNFGVYQDYVMLLSAVVANIYLFRRK
jgi:hypothetical protein